MQLQVKTTGMQRYSVQASQPQKRNESLASRPNINHCGWENCTEYHCTPMRSFLKFFTVAESPPTLAILAQTIQLAQGPIKRLAQAHRAQLGEKGVQLRAIASASWWFSGKGLGSVKPVGYEPKPFAALKQCQAATSLSVVDKNKFKQQLKKYNMGPMVMEKKNALKRRMRCWISF